MAKFKTSMDLQGTEAGYFVGEDASGFVVSHWKLGVNFWRSIKRQRYFFGKGSDFAIFKVSMTKLLTLSSFILDLEELVSKLLGRSLYSLRGFTAPRGFL
jgi:hypothetical protein